MKSTPVFGATLLAYLASASPAPQQLDFGVIAAAPSVASGPDDNGSSNQTATLATTFTLAPSSAATNAASKRQVVRRQSGSNFNTAYNAAFGSQNTLTTVGKGATHWLSGGSTHNIYGNLDNSGSIYISQTSYLKSNPNAGGQTCDWVGHDSNNGNLNNQAGALIQLNDIGSASAPTYDWYLHSVVNNGTIQWCGRGDTGGCTFQFYSDTDAVNNGLISYEQAFDNKGASFAWRNPSLTTSGPTSNIYNNGAFRLINTVHHNVQNVYGSGCWQLGKGGVLYLEDGTGVYQNAKKGPSFPGQSISFQDSSAVLHMDTGVYSKNSNFGAKIYGFGSGNAIEFYEYIRNFNYDAGSGTLSVYMWSGYSVSMSIGLGYDASKFVNQRNPSKYNFWGYNAIFYKGSCPSQSAPSTCSMSAPPCGDLGSNPPTTSKPVWSTSTSQPATVKTSTSTWAVTTSSAATSSSTASPTSTSVPSTSFSTSTSTSAATSGVPTTSTTATTTDISGVSTTSSSTTACPTTPEEGTYCGFINPEDPCAPQPDGYGPVPTPDTASAFLAYPPFHSMASAAPTIVPSTNGTQYTQTFRDLNASSSAQSYLGLLTLKSYDVQGCAAACDNAALCTAFNIYIERDPSQNPTNNDSTAPTVWGYYCPNPKSITNYKCTLWGSELDASTATNTGETREQFQVVITGSNGYDKTNVTTPDQPTGPSTTDIPTSTSSSSVASSTSTPSTTSPATVGSTSTSTSAAVTTPSPVTSTSAAATTHTPKPKPTGCPSPWNPPHNCHGKAIDAPKSWLGSYFFPGPYNPQACADFALGKNVFNKGAAQKAGKSSYTPCQMFNAYYLHKNGKPHGTYCSLYSDALDPSWATYGGGVDKKGDKYECHGSWTFELSVHDSGKC